MNVTRRDIFKSLVLLSIPTVIEHIMSTLMQYVDTAMVGRLGEEATAAVSTTTTVNWLVSTIPFAISTGTLALIARANGEGDEARMRRYAGLSALLSLVIGSVVMVSCLLLSPYIPVWMGAEESVQGPASSYFFIVSLALVFRTFGYVFGSAIRATKDTRTPMRINLCANVLNVILNYLLIYRLALHVNGAAIATAVSYSLAGIAMFFAARQKSALRFTTRDLRPDMSSIRQYTEISLPALGTGVASCLGYVFFASMVSHMGTTVFAAHSIAVTAEELFYIPGYGFRTATSSLIGNAVGERDERKLKITEHLSIAITLLMMFVSGVALYLLSGFLMRIFTPVEAVQTLGSGMLRMIAFTEPFFGLMIVLEGIFYGKGKTRGVFFVETGSMWLVRIFFTFLGTTFWGFTLREVWYCMIADNVCKALLLFVLYRRDDSRGRR